MSRSPQARPDPAATPLVPTRPRTGRADAGHRGHAGGSHERHARVTRLWDAIRRARAELETRERRDGWIGNRFATLIRPREQAFTAAVCRTTERLVQHHECTGLDTDERTLLGLWIDENLHSLATHPFAPREAADALVRRWREHLGRASHPLDIPLASLHATWSGGAFRENGEERATAGDDGPDTDTGSDGTAGREGGPEAMRARREAPRGRRAGGGASPADGERANGGASGTGDDPERIVSRLFRRLACVLHPDRESDETRRPLKHRLMSDCLRARDEGDIDTLLSLHLEHVGALPDDIARDDPDGLAHLLRRQLDTLRTRLRRHAAGGSLDALIVARYAADDRRERERRFDAHADALDGEIERVEDLAHRLDDVEGLREALVARRALELDRLAIAELTGAGD